MMELPCTYSVEDLVEIFIDDDFYDDDVSYIGTGDGEWSGYFIFTDGLEYMYVHKSWVKRRFPRFVRFKNLRYYFRRVKWRYDI